MHQTFTKLICAFFLLSAGMATAQTPFWSQDFGNGIPAGWNTQDVSANNVDWEYCTGPNANCAKLYGHAVFASTTATNGFAILDSDGGGNLGSSEHISQLTTPAINCSTQPQVFAVFENYIGVYNPSSDSSIVLKVSTDGVNWTGYTVFSGAANTFSGNPLVSAIDISAVAANKATVYLRWEWIGNYEYWWMLDDIKLYNVDPTPANDLVLGAFFYPPSSYAQPASEIATDTFSFFANVSNRGVVNQTNVKLFAFVADNNNNVLYEDSMQIDVLPVGYADSLIILPGRFAPELNTGQYSVVYFVSSDSTDARPNDNVEGDFFEVTDNVFSKERGPTGANRPGTPGNYSFSNLYSLSTESLEKYKAVSFDFATAVDPPPATLALADVEVTAYLFKVKDDVLPDFSNFDLTNFPGASLDWVGVGAYSFPDGAADYELQTVNIDDANSGQAGGVVLETGARYFATIEYSDVNNAAYHATSDEFSHYYISSWVYTDADGWFDANQYGADFNPEIRMNLDLVTAVDETPLPETVMAVLPNPIQTTLNLQIGFDQPTDATITIADLSGRVINIDNRKGLTNEILSYQVPQLSNGLYIARIATATGTRTKKFEVQK